MEINITHLLETDLFPFSHSRAEGGENAGRETWDAALIGPRPLLNTPEEFEAFRDHVGEFGAWSEEEIAAWDNNECQALFLQLISGDVRECPAILEAVEFEDRLDETPEGASRVTAWYFQTPVDKENDLETGPFDTRSEAYRAASDEVVGFNQTRRAESLEEVDWLEYEIQASSGRISGRLYHTDSGEVFYELGN